MKLNELKLLLHSHPDALPRFLLPSGEWIPEHLHLTEVGHVKKSFIDCGGVFHEQQSCVLQTHLGTDTEHRLRAKRMAEILELARTVVPNEELQVEIEWDCGVISQYPIAEAEGRGGEIEFRLGDKHTACLARQSCDCSNEAEAATCCR